MTVLDRRRLRWSVVLAALVVQLLVLYLPEAPDTPGGIEIPGADKVVHVAVFAAVTSAGLAAHLRRGLVVGYGVVQALLSETVQHLVLPARSGDPFDVVADLAGVGLGILAVSGWRTRSDRVRSGPDR